MYIHKPKIKISSPIRLLMIVILSTFLVEILLMYVLPFLVAIPREVISWLDSILLAALTFPVVYYFSFRPMAQHLAKREQAENALKQAKDNAQLFSEQQETNRRLLEAYDETLDGWSKAMDLHDHETEGHSQRVADLTLKLARQLNVPEEHLAQLYRGAKLHDIGKMAIPDRILTKPGPLTDEEWTIMRQHPVLAFDFLSPIKFLHPAMDVPYCHHEKWDGNGYPRGLKGEEIPLFARIFAVIDVYDALTSDRPYRLAWSKQQALDYIKKQSEKQFDPQIVEEFIKLMEKDKKRKQ